MLLLSLALGVYIALALGARCLIMCYLVFLSWSFFVACDHDLVESWFNEQKIFCPGRVVLPCSCHCALWGEPSRTKHSVVIGDRVSISFHPPLLLPLPTMALHADVALPYQFQRRHSPGGVHSTRHHFVSVDVVVVAIVIDDDNISHSWSRRFLYEGGISSPAPLFHCAHPRGHE